MQPRARGPGIFWAAVCFVACVAMLFAASDVAKAQCKQGDYDTINVGVQPATLAAEVPAAVGVRVGVLNLLDASIHVGRAYYQPESLANPLEYSRFNSSQLNCGVMCARFGIVRPQRRLRL